MRWVAKGFQRRSNILGITGASKRRAIRSATKATPGFTWMRVPECEKTPHTSLGTFPGASQHGVC